MVFDRRLGGTVVSTEDVFFHLADWVTPRQILLAGVDEGVWGDFPQCSRLIDTIRAQDDLADAGILQGSAQVDVTGGMREKVNLMVSLIRSHPGASARIFSGAQPDNLYRVLLGEPIGTLIHH